MIKSNTSKGDEVDPLIVSIFMALIGITIVLIMIFSYIGILVNADATCGANIYTNVTSSSRSLSSYVLDDSSKAILQEFKVSENDNLYYEFCFMGNYTGGTGAEIRITNEGIDDSLNQGIIGQVLVNPLDLNYCTTIKKEFVTTNNLFGLTCPTCGGLETFTIYQDPLGSIVEQVNLDAVPPTTITVTTDETLIYKLIGHRNCKHLITFYARWYSITLLIIGIMFLSIIGWKKLRDKLLEVEDFV